MFVTRDQAIFGAGIVALTSLAWWYLVRMAGAMNGMAMDAAMPGMTMWTAPDLWMLFTMWTVMMVAMMLPSAAPVMLLMIGTYRHRTGRGFTTEAAMFLAGYLVEWVGFSFIAALAQGGLHRAALLSPSMAASSAWLGGGLLILTGAYQWSPLKSACLQHCRSPLHLAGSHWREGAFGALSMGVSHGKYCVGCCWALMAVLFVAGVMNLVWVAAIAILVLIEKVSPRGPLAGRLSGAALGLWGIWQIAMR